MGVFWVTTHVTVPGKAPLQFPWEAPYATMADLMAAFERVPGLVLGDKLSTEWDEAGQFKVIVGRDPVILCAGGFAMITNARGRFVEVEE